MKYLLALLLLCFVAPAWAQVVCPSNVNAVTPAATSCWPLQENAGTAITDTIDANTGTLAGSYQLNQYPGGIACNGISGSGCSITTPQNYATPQPMTLYADFAGTSGGLVQLGPTSAITAAPSYVLFLDNHGKLTFGINNFGATNVVQSPLPYADGNRHRAAVSLGPAGSFLYVDGQPVAQGSPQLASYASGYWFFGGINPSGWQLSPPQQFFNGMLITFAWWNGTQLTDHQMKMLTANQVVPGGGPVAAGCPPAAGYADVEGCAIGASSPNVATLTELHSVAPGTSALLGNWAGDGSNTSSAINNSLSAVNLGGALNVQSFAGSDACVKFNNAVLYAQAHNVQRIWWEPGAYSVSTKCIVPLNIPSVPSSLDVWAYGVVLSSSGLTTEFEVDEGGGKTRTTIHGLKIDDSANTTATTAFNFAGVAQASCIDCQVQGNIAVPPVGYTMFHVGNRTPGNDSTFSQSATISRGTFSGTTLNSCSITLDSAYQVQIDNSFISGGQYGVCMTSDAATAAPFARLPQWPRFINNDIEVFSNACFYLNPLANAASTRFQGFLALGNRCDKNNAVSQYGESLLMVSSGLNFQGAPIYLSGNIPSGLGQYINNQSAAGVLKVISLEDTSNHSSNGVVGYPGAQFETGLTVDDLELQNGIGGGVSVLQNPIPDLAVSVGGTPGATQYCYRTSAVDWRGKETKPANERCTLTGNAVLSATNYVQVRANPDYTHPCGYRVYGRSSGAEQLMVPASPATCGGLSVSMLSTDTGDQVGPRFIDDGSLTPSGAVTTANATGEFALAGGHLLASKGTAAPAAGSGTASVDTNSSDVRGKFTVSASNPTASAAINFNVPWGAAPDCTVSEEATATAAQGLKVTTTTSALTVAVATDFHNDVLHYHCESSS